MKNLAIILLFMFATNYIQAQNLVPNFSFEDTVQCPTPNSQIQYATGWISPNGYSPDYYHSCANSSNPNYGIPNNFYGFQNPLTGIAYGGIYLPVNASNDLREYVQIQLMDTLVSGIEYIVKFNVSLADSSIFSVNSLGAYLSNNPISSPTLKVFNLIPQVVNNPIVNPLTNKNVWYEISDTITAVGGEEYITIGNFQFDSIVDTTTVIGGGSNLSFASYYYVEDVSIETKPNSINEIDNDNILKLYPNPVSNFLTIKLNKIGDYNIQLFDMLGNTVFSKQIITNGDTFNLKEYSNGIYFIQLSENNKILKINKLIINH